MRIVLVTLTIFAFNAVGAEIEESNDNKIPKLYYDKAVPTVHPDLTELSKTFEPKIYQITETVYGAIGYGLSNSYMIIRRTSHC